jgi:Ion channel
MLRWPHAARHPHRVMRRESATFTLTRRSMESAGQNPAITHHVISKEMVTVPLRAGHARHPGSGLGQPRRRYGVLLLLLIVNYLLSAFRSGAWVDSVQIVLFVTVAILTLRASRVRLLTRLTIGVALVGSAIAASLALSRISEIGDGIANLWTGLVLLLTALIIVERVIKTGTVTLQSIYGAVSAYLILGLMFAAFYSAMFHFGGDKFFAGGRPGTTQTFQYFSFTTLTTLGYGDFTAAQSSGQAVAVIEAITGQVFLATLVARLVASFRAPQQVARETLRPPQRAGRRRNAAIDQNGTIASRRTAGGAGPGKSPRPPDRGATGERPDSTARHGASEARPSSIDAL